MFESATLKLTGWYLLIIMVISLLFSALVFQTATGEVRAQLEQFGQRLPQMQLDADSSIVGIRSAQADAAAYNIFIQLLYINIVVLIGGGLMSYLMAKRTLRPLEEAHDAQSQFVSDASHELRTPLAVMKTELEVALQDPRLPKKEMRELLKSNLEEVDKLTKLSHTLLALSRREYTALTHEEIDLVRMTKTVAKKYDSAGRIRVQQKNKQIYIDAHAPSIEELLAILIDNALKYSPARSRVTVTLARRGNKALFSIRDTGKGIAAKDLPHIFDRFYRADNARSSSQTPSFGLGLSLAHQIVELHNGELTASSRVGKGSTFTVELPAIGNNGKNTTKNS